MIVVYFWSRHYNRHLLLVQALGSSFVVGPGIMIFIYCWSRHYDRHLFMPLYALTTVPEAHPKQILHKVRPSASFSNLDYPLIPLRSYSICLPLVPRLPVTSILPVIFPSITCSRRQFLRKM